MSNLCSVLTRQSTGRTTRPGTLLCSSLQLLLSARPRESSSLKVFFEDGTSERCKTRFWDCTNIHSCVCLHLLFCLQGYRHFLPIWISGEIFLFTLDTICQDAETRHHLPLTTSSDPLLHSLHIPLTLTLENHGQLPECIVASFEWWSHLLSPPQSCLCSFPFFNP